MGLRLFVCAAVCFLVAGCATAKKSNVVSQEESLSTSGTVGGQEEIVSDETGAQGITSESKDTGMNAVSSPKSAASLTKHDIQTALKNAGYYDGPIDGKLGAKTREAIRGFQKANGLEVDGIAGKKTKALLVKYLSK